VAAPRKPRALAAEAAVVTPAEFDVFDEADIAAAEPPPATAPRRRSRIGAIFLTAFGILISLGVGLWTDRLIRDLFSRADWLGWLAVAAAGIAASALVVILARELLAVFRLASVERLRNRATDAIARNDPAAARKRRRRIVEPFVVEA
jgi:putative membrane protein